ncbi:repressor LexA [Candidatus Uhrbacteria bacterium RIFCSPHIGHO2_02_FULL_57_19]|uniref:LexA repressor n=1 Tax=Candidatus Uhrbacteria bacterium RIFCSPHIGHO2_02_FULL_57_19 TaxID=1802391 RepID=A0A1F7U5F2_9BACT|nr:MAG: repressor LexA [Candidatus Uhrbacteria bacterium RIFCSPHIGHO2_02_FULL_57_19]
MGPLTKKQKEILDYIIRTLKEDGFTPSHRQIAEALDLSSPATVHEHVERLREKGYLKSNDGDGSPIEVVPSLLRFDRALVLPLVGLITAGAPIEAIEEKETMAVPAKLVVDGMNSYVLRVKGRSMIEDGILDGDYVVVERNPSPKNGDVVVALMDNAYATLKRFYRESGRIRLQPANSEMKPIYVKPNDLSIQGVVCAVIRQFRVA